jgi:hypothetical protein
MKLPHKALQTCYIIFVKLYYWNCSGYQELDAAHSTAVACAQVNSLIHKLPALFNPLSLSLSLTPNPLFKQFCTYHTKPATSQAARCIT